MSDVVKFTPGGFAAGAKKFQNVTPKPGMGGIDLLRMRKQDGVWVRGRDGLEIEDVKLVLDANTMAQGYVDWHMSKPVGEFMAVVARGDSPINPQDLPPAQGKDGWSSQFAFGLVILEGEDKDVPVLYKSNTYGAEKAYAALYDAILAKAAAGEPYNPVVELSNDSYTHSQWGLTFNPIFTIVDWMGEKHTAVEAADEAPEAEVEDDIPEAEVVEEPPRGKRRRRGA